MSNNRDTRETPRTRSISIRAYFAYRHKFSDVEKLCLFEDACNRRMNDGSYSLHTEERVSSDFNECTVVRNSNKMLTLFGKVFVHDEFPVSEKIQNGSEKCWIPIYHIRSSSVLQNGKRISGK